MDASKKIANEEPENLSISESITAMGTASDNVFPRQPMIFHCRMCIFRARIPEDFKNHMQLKHGKIRPRIYFCINCRKSYGILQSYRVHLVTVHGRTVEEAKALAYAQRDGTVARVNAEEIDMNAKTEAVPDYKFDVHASTLKAANISIKYVCDFCDSELTTIHQMQEHMKTAHGTEPHLNVYNKGAAKAEKTSKLKPNSAQEEDVYLINDVVEESNPSTSKNEKNMKVQPHKKARLQEIPPIPEGHNTKYKCPGCKTSFFSVLDYANHCVVCVANGHWYPCGVGNCCGIFMTRKFLLRHLTLDHKFA